MKLYEIYTILKPQLSEEQVNNFTTDLEKKLGEQEVRVENSEIKLGQRLSYPIKHQQTGNMVRLRVSTEERKDISSIVNEHLVTNENVLRRMIINRPPEAEKTQKPISVIDQIRRERRLRSQDPAPSSFGDIESTKEKESAAAKATVDKEEKTPDIEEIDKKIEELLT